jgi:HAMP domain-containing protein
MFKNMSIRKRVFVILALVYLLSMVIVVGGGYVLLTEDTRREAAEKTELFLRTMTANQKYMGKFVRPQLKEILSEAGGDIHFPEASVGAVMMGGTARILNSAYPEYNLKISSPNPLNPQNQSSPFEEQIIAGFDKGDYDEWSGFTEIDGESFYASAIPIEARKGCIWCHDTPEVAHPDQVEEYGSTSGYGYKEGDIVGTRICYVSTQKIVDLTYKKLGFLSGAVSLLFLLALIVIDLIINRSVVKPIENIVDIAGDISRGKMDRSFDVDTNDEIKSLADAFNRMKVSLQKAMDILKR